MKYAEIVLNESGNTIVDFTSRLHTTILKMIKDKKPNDDILPLLISLANIKLYTENFKKMDKDRKLMIALLGVGKKVNIAQLIPQLFKKDAKKKVDELFLPDDNTNNPRIIDKSLMNNWVKDINWIFSDEERKLQNLITLTR